VYKNVWDALEADPIVRNNLMVRSKLLDVISEAIEDSGETQSVIAKQLDITQPRVSAIMKGKIDKFSVDNLMAIAFKLGLNVVVEIEDNASNMAA
jgi:predicted XRE-type DNA-binding protein